MDKYKYQGSSLVRQPCYFVAQFCNILSVFVGDVAGVAASAYHSIRFGIPWPKTTFVTHILVIIREKDQEK
jgi:hypothetical protein